MLNNRKIRLSMYVALMWFVTIPHCMYYGNLVDEEQCPTDDSDYNWCNLNAGGWFLMLILLTITTIFIIINFNDFFDSKIIKVIIGIIMIIISIILIAGNLTYISDLCEDYDGDDCCGCNVIGPFWFIFTNLLLLGIDYLSDYASDNSKRLLSYSVMYFIGIALLMAYEYSDDNPQDIDDIGRSGLLYIQYIQYICLSLHTVY